MEGISFGILAAALVGRRIVLSVKGETSLRVISPKPWLISAQRCQNYSRHHVDVTLAGEPRAGSGWVTANQSTAILVDLAINTVWLHIRVTFVFSVHSNAIQT